MLRRTLIDFFDDLTKTDGQFLTYDDGYRTRSYKYVDVANAAAGVGQSHQRPREY